MNEGCLKRSLNTLLMTWQDHYRALYTFPLRNMSCWSYIVKINQEISVRLLIAHASEQNENSEKKNLFNQRDSLERINLTVLRQEQSTTIFPNTECRF